MAEGSLRAEFATVVRRRIREAALALFTEGGYRATTIRQIAIRAGTTHTTLYKYFRSKEAIAFGLLEEIAPTAGSFYARIGRVIDDPALFDAWFDDYADFWSVNRAIYHAFWEAVHANGEIASRLSRRARTLVAASVSETGRGRSLGEGQEERLALWLLSVDNLMSLAHITAEDGRDSHADLRALLKAAFHGLFHQTSTGARPRISH